MPGFGDLENEAKKEAAGHGGDVDKGVTDAESQVDQHTDHKGDAEVSKAGDEAENALGADQGDSSQPANQPPQ